MKRTVLFASLPGLVLIASCGGVPEPPASASFGQASTPPPAPAVQPIPTASPLTATAPPPPALVSFLRACSPDPSLQLGLFQLRQGPTKASGLAFHGWSVARHRQLSGSSAEAILTWLTDPHTFHPDACLCGTTPPDFGLRISCGATSLDLVLDRFRLVALGTEQEVSLNSTAREPFLSAIARAIAGGA